MRRTDADDWAKRLSRGSYLAATFFAWGGRLLPDNSRRWFVPQMKRRSVREKPGVMDQSRTETGMGRPEDRAYLPGRFRRDFIFEADGFFQENPFGGQPLAERRLFGKRERPSVVRGLRV